MVLWVRDSFPRHSESEVVRSQDMWKQQQLLRPGRAQFS